MKKLKVAVVGGSGYGAGELLRILFGHPNVEIIAVVSSSKQGEPIAESHKNLAGFTDLRFTEKSLEEVAGEVEVMFFALPHKTAKTIIPGIMGDHPQTAIIDLSGDFRLKDPAVYEKYYGTPPAEDLLGKFVYGLSEYNRTKIVGAKYIANPGCFATGTLFALLPLAAEGLLKGTVVVDAMTGSSGSGVQPKPGTHHPHRDGNFWAYKVLEHQHEPEILQCIHEKGDNEFGFAFIPHSLPLVRGIFTTATIVLKDDVPFEKIERTYEKHYADKKFVRRVASSPQLKMVAGTNFIEYSLKKRGNTLVVMTAIDNLVRGAAGQAIQNMNIMFGLEETAGLFVPSVCP